MTSPLSACYRLALACLIASLSSPESVQGTAASAEETGGIEAEIQSMVKEFQAPWKGPQLKLFHHVSLTPKQQSWLDSLHTAGPRSGTSTTAIRKEIRQLTIDEWQKLFRVFWKMQNTYPDPDEAESEYGLFVKLHRPTTAPGAHFGAAFLPWHREYLWRVEMAMRKHDPEVALVYWDATLDQPLPEPMDSVLWSEHLMGNNDGIVNRGLFANWPIIPECHHPSGNLLKRNAGPNDAGINTASLYNDNVLAFFWQQTEFKDLMSPGVGFESHHGRGHVAVGGHMGEILCSPSDPLFWMHHSFVDFIWEEFRQKSQLTNRELEYPSLTDGDFGDIHHDAKSYMEPFRPQYNIHGLSNHYTNYYYRYAPRSVHCKRQAHCGSPYMWCDTTRWRCTSKIKLGGECGSLPHKACYQSKCKCGVCS